MNIKSLVIVLGCLLMVGCNEEVFEREQRIKNNNAAGQNPQLILEQSPKGRLYCITIRHPEDRYRDHFVYFFDNDSNHTVTMNHSEMEGKVSVNKVVVINGVEYIPKK